jgi:hypothetical protein
MIKSGAIHFKYLAKTLAWSLGLALVSLLLSSGAVVNAQNPRDAIVILKVTFEGSGKPEVGTGFFVDHDGLIITAEHVVNKYLTTPTKVPFDPGEGKKAKKIEIFNRLLPNGKAVINVPVDHPNIVTGRLENGKWLDLAVFRLDLDSATVRISVKRVRASRYRP